MDTIVTVENNPFFEKSVSRQSGANKLVNVLQALVIVAFLLILIYLFIATPNQVSGVSMLPNFQDKDLLLTNRMVQWFNGTVVGSTLGLEYNRGDVIVIQTPELPNEDYIIKRLIALPGDTIGVRDGYVLLNGERLDETAYLPPERRTTAGDYLQEGDVLTVPQGFYAILGDNRPQSLDSRYSALGFVPKSNLIGKVIFRFWPPESITYIGTAQDTSRN